MDLLDDGTLYCLWCDKEGIISKTYKTYQCDECYKKIVERRNKDIAYFKYQEKILNICNCIYGHKNCMCGMKNENKG